MKRTEAQVYMRRHQGAEVKHSDVSNVIYHKLSHGAASYTLNGKNVNVMLEYLICFRYMLEVRRALKRIYFQDFLKLNIKALACIWYRFGFNDLC